ncbi:unnamed protein product [Amaranthus hypochondriacus]
MEEQELHNHIQPDPLLKPGAFIDPYPFSNYDTPYLNPVKRIGGGARNSKGKPSTPDKETLVGPTPDWLPPGWICKERVRASGASAGARDKYYIDPVTQRRFRSKNEVLNYLETGTPKKRRNIHSDADHTPRSESKRKKSNTKVKDVSMNFNFEDVPEKVTCNLRNNYETTWTPSFRGADRVPDPVQQEWAATYTYLNLQHNGRSGFI